ncbi:MAG: hypothetical protein PV340_00830 [Wolbachia sp.]|nr:hypothetical protein [Wolbachia sp.]MDD9336339.1 hypothetical protein [Wolbachia sp.]
MKLGTLITNSILAAEISTLACGIFSLGIFLIVLNIAASRYVHSALKDNKSKTACYTALAVQITIGVAFVYLISCLAPMLEGSSLITAEMLYTLQTPTMD